MNADEKERAEAARFLDNLTEFLANDNRTEQEIKEDLRAEELSPEELLKDLHSMLSEYAPTWKEKAERERSSAKRSLLREPTRIPATRDDLTAAIESKMDALKGAGASVEAGAFHLKFQKATDEDLKSMLEDLTTQLEILKRQNKSDG